MVFPCVPVSVTMVIAENLLLDLAYGPSFCPTLAELLRFTGCSPRHHGNDSYFK